MKNSCERVRKKNVKINIFKWIFFSTIWIQVLNMNQEEYDMHVLFSYCTMYIHAFMQAVVLMGGVLVLLISICVTTKSYDITRA